jgi:hypothetical protein
VYVRDIGTHITTLISCATGAAGAKADAPSFGAAISGDGSRVAFVSDADNLSAADRAGVTDAYVRDTAANTTTLVSRASGASGTAGNDDSYDAAISADGRFVAFGSHATILSLADPDPTTTNTCASCPLSSGRRSAARVPRRPPRASASPTRRRGCGNASRSSSTAQRCSPTGSAACPNLRTQSGSSTIRSTPARVARDAGSTRTRRAPPVNSSPCAPAPAVRP